MAQPIRSSEPNPNVIHLREVVVTDTQKVARRSPEYQAYQILRVAFTIAPIVAGLDKFTNILAKWDDYLAPIVPQLTGIAPHNFMQAVGVIEIVAGLGVALKPKFFAYVVSGWLLGITVDLLLTGQFFDIALRDFGLCLAALALGRLASRFDRKNVETS